MKNYLFSILLFVFIFAGFNISELMAQNTGMFGMQQLMVQHAEELNLTDDQKKAIAELHFDMRRPQRGTLRGNRPATKRGDVNRQRQNGPRRSANERANRSEQLFEILTDEQISALSGIRAANAENAHEFRTLRHGLLIDRAGISGEKADEALSILNRQSELRLELALKNIDEPGNLGRDDRIEFVNESRKLQDELKNLLTAAEYEKVQSHMGAGNRANWRMDRRNRATRR